MRTFPECCGNVDESAVNRARVEKEGAGSLEDFGQGQLDRALKGEWRVCRQGMGEGYFYQSVNIIDKGPPSWQHVLCLGSHKSPLWLDCSLAVEKSKARG